MAVRDWINFLGDTGEWGLRANAWMNELRDTVVSLVTDVGVLEDRADALETHGFLSPIDQSFTTTTVPGFLLATYTIPEDGTYMYSASCIVEYSVAATYFVTFIARNESDAALVWSRTSIDPSGTRFAPLAFDERRTFTAGQEIRLYIYRNNAAGSVIMKQCHMTVRRVV